MSNDLILSFTIVFAVGFSLGLIVSDQVYKHREAKRIETFNSLASRLTRVNQNAAYGFMNLSSKFDAEKANEQLRDLTKALDKSRDFPNGDDMSFDFPRHSPFIDFKDCKNCGRTEHKPIASQFGPVESMCAICGEIS